MPVLYLIATGAPPAAELPAAIESFQSDGWQVCVVATPMGLRFIDRPRVENVTGYLIRSEYRQSGETDPFPPADAVAVAPCTFNTLNKWAAGISDTLALGILNELLCSGLPIVASVWAKEPLRRHPAFQASVGVLRSAGVRFVGDGSGPAAFEWLPLREALLTAHAAE